MSNLNHLLPVRELSNAEVWCVAGGGDPTSAEVEITGLMLNDTIVGSGSNDLGSFVTTDKGVTLYDTDGNGHYDYAEWYAGGDMWVYDTTTHSWVTEEEWRDRRDEDFPVPDEVEG